VLSPIVSPTKGADGRSCCCSPDPTEPIFPTNSSHMQSLQKSSTPWKKKKEKPQTLSQHSLSPLCLFSLSTTHFPKIHFLSHLLLQQKIAFLNLMKQDAWMNANTISCSVSVCVCLCRRPSLSLSLSLNLFLSLSQNLSLFRQKTGSGLIVGEAKSGDILRRIGLAKLRATMGKKGRVCSLWNGNQQLLLMRDSKTKKLNPGGGFSFLSPNPSPPKNRQD